MVIQRWLSFAGASPLAFEQAARPLIERLDPPRRAAVVMALMAIMLTGVLLVACVMIGARWVRRHTHGERRRGLQTSRAANRRLRDALGPILPQGTSGETTVAKAPTDETVADR